MATKSLGFHSDAVQWKPGHGSRTKSSHPDASDEDIYWFAQHKPTTGTLGKLCVSEEMLRKLEGVLHTNIKARWIVL
jgi:hypothetical protein